jgi:hypothetical protein
LDDPFHTNERFSCIPAPGQERKRQDSKGGIHLSHWNHIWILAIADLERQGDFMQTTFEFVPAAVRPGGAAFLAGTQKFKGRLQKLWIVAGAFRGRKDCHNSTQQPEKSRP